MAPILQEFGLTCLFFATGASADETPSMLWYEELYLMLLDARDCVSLTLSDTGSIGVTPIAPDQRHASWWNLVNHLSRFDRESRRKFLDQVRDQLKLSGNWSDQYVQDSTLAARFLILDRAGLRQLAAAGMTIGAHSLSHPILARTSRNWLGGKSLKAGASLRMPWGIRFGRSGIRSATPLRLQRETCGWPNKPVFDAPL